MLQYIKCQWGKKKRSCLSLESHQIDSMSVPFLMECLDQFDVHVSKKDKKKIEKMLG